MKEGFEPGGPLWAVKTEKWLVGIGTERCNAAAAATLAGQGAHGHKIMFPRASFALVTGKPEDFALIHRCSEETGIWHA